MITVSCVYKDQTGVERGTGGEGVNRCRKSDYIRDISMIDYSDKSELL
jgi:hypothetical protein